jgi:hypothetical protein
MITVDLLVAMKSTTQMAEKYNYAGMVYEWIGLGYNISKLGFCIQYISDFGAGILICMNF